jgi:hypothetical protein
MGIESTYSCACIKRVKIIIRITCIKRIVLNIVGGTSI